jgi:hypothetical protein
MVKAILANKSVPRVEIDQRLRDARLRLEQIERLLVPRAAVIASCLRQVSFLFSGLRPSEGSRTAELDKGR